jgi:hypothetical protein
VYILCLNNQHIKCLLIICIENRGGNAAMQIMKSIAAVARVKCVAHSVSPIEGDWLVRYCSIVSL